MLPRAHRWSMRFAGIAARNIRASPAAAQGSPGTGPPEMLNLAAPSTYLTFFADALQFAIFPKIPRPPAAGPLHRSSKRGARLWVSNQIRENLVAPPPGRARENLVDPPVNQLGKAYPKVLR